MIWNAWVLGLIIGQMATVAINAVAFANALRIVRNWNTNSMLPMQLDLEHRSELIATIVSCSLLFQAFSLMVFEITARSLAPFVPGAMCTVGILEAQPLGWPVLFLKIAALFLYGWWIVLNHLDNQVEGFPLTILKSWYLIVIFPMILTDLLLQIAFFTHLDPAVITSCCGVVFEVEGEGFGSSVASLPPKLTMVGLVGLVAVLFLLSLLLRRMSTQGGCIAYAFGSGAGLVLGIAGVISFVAPYVYMMPALHCPFIFLDEEHSNYGYLVYLPLLAASFFGMSAGILVVVERGFQSLVTVSHNIRMRYVQWSGLLWLVFLAAAYGPVIKFWIATGGKADLFQVGY
ncbi:MAG: hypothetical protein HY912_04310 [Desulfomonile tiedjei]|uniref:Uncharacterized protein n=1 Tax=Desulfomonile tiedjei TaxID=2358 RepID=A0A9D6V2B6_9BACT|nr:hypothetical protein [Desulfomonile tiedjei]